MISLFSFYCDSIKNIKISPLLGWTNFQDIRKYSKYVLRFRVFFVFVYFHVDNTGLVDQICLIF